MIRAIAAMALALWLGLAPDRTAANDSANVPNLVIINIDDLGYADIGPFGSEINRTPNLDRMAAEGRKLTSFYAAPVCTPSRSSLMTGCYPKRVGLPKVLFPAGQIGLNTEETTLAEYLKKQGYATACIGKWHLGDQPQFLPNRHGFDFYLGLPYSNDMGPAADGIKSSFGEPLKKDQGSGQPPLPLLKNDAVLARVDADGQTTLVDRYTAEATRFLREKKDERFFLYLPHSAVHFPIYPGDAFRGKSPHGIYSDWVEEVDWSVGKVLDTIRELGLEEKTLVIFTSDNGGTPRAINRPLRGFKASTWEGGMRAPTIVWWPNAVPAGTATHEIASMFDLLPTFVGLAGGTVSDERPIDGKDIRPLLLDDAAKSPHEAFFYFRNEDLEAVRSDRWKLFFKGTVLYDLQTDIGETTNVAAQHPEIVSRLQQFADAMRADLGDGKPGPGCRPPGRVNDPQPILSKDGEVRSDLRDAR